ncbi:MAG: hypothetical protein ACYC7D_15715 [Nitrososphaerales archaeon]
MISSQKSEAMRFVSESGLALVIFAFSAIVGLNLLTLYFGLVSPLVSFVEFDSWGTIAGLIGVVILFVPVLLGRESGRPAISLYFVCASIGIGVLAGLTWNEFYQSQAYGSSSIAIASQAIVFTLSCTGLFRIARGSMPGYMRGTFVVIYSTIIVTTLWFILILQPIFAPSSGYNWAVHEIAFLIGVLATLVFDLMISK